MLDKLKEIEKRYCNIEDQLSFGNASSEQLVKLTQEHAKLQPIVTIYRQYLELDEDLALAFEMSNDSDPEVKSLGIEEVKKIQAKSSLIYDQLIILLLPQDPLDDKNVILEIRAGTGGDEAALFVGDLVRMYHKFAEKNSWRFEALSSSPAQTGGFKEAIFSVSGNRVYSSLKFEIGVHRVQRVPITESQGRLHTSACTVAVLPEMEEVEVSINPADLEIKTCRSSGAGGQHVNKTDSAIRILHIPTGIAVECQEERSQHKNKEKAMKVLKSRIYDQAQKQQEDSISANRKSQVGSGDRSQRIRTYNFPQGRITDHRINLTIYKLQEVLEGNLSEIIDKLGAHYTSLLLKESKG